MRLAFRFHWHVSVSRLSFPTRPKNPEVASPFSGTRVWARVLVNTAAVIILLEPLRGTAPLSGTRVGARVLGSRTAVIAPPRHFALFLVPC